MSCRKISLSPRRFRAAREIPGPLPFDWRSSLGRIREEIDKHYIRTHGTMSHLDILNNLKVPQFIKDVLRVEYEGMIAQDVLR